MNLYINPNPSLEEAAIVGEAIRLEETRGLEAIGCSPADSCLEGIRESAYVGTINTPDDVPIALVGIVDYQEDENTGLVWSMNTGDVNKYPLSFTRVMIQLMEEYGGLYDRLVSLVLSDNIAHQRWQATLGMTFTGIEIPVPHSPLMYKVYEIVTAKGLNKIYYEQP